MTSPRDGTGLRNGGTCELLGNLEYIIPLPFNIRIAGFFDIGNVYGFNTKFDPTDLREAAGAGIRWQSPFGPIRIDYGVNLDRRKGEDFGALQFSVGSPFLEGGMKGAGAGAAFVAGALIFGG